MASGGPRLNAGRRPGSPNVVSKAAAVTPSARRQLTDALVEKVKDINVSPLEVMIVGMKLHYDQGRGAMALHEAEKDIGKRATLMRTAKAEMSDSMSYAKELAPYIHAKLQSVTLKGDKENPLEVALGLSDAESLRKLIRGR